MRGVSVAIIARNEEGKLAAALGSLLPEGALGFPWEILVLDNGSTDGSRNDFLSFQRAHPEVDCRWIDHRPNHLGRSRARAVVEARYPIVAFLDADCVAPPGWLRERHRAWEEIEDPRLIGLGGGNVTDAGEGPTAAALSLVLSSWLGGLHALQARPLPAPAIVRHIPTCNLWYRREAVLSLGNFSPDFASVCEDLELNLRAFRAGYRLRYQPGLAVLHRQSPTLLRWAEKMFRYGRGQIDTAWRYPEHLAGVKGLPLLLGASFVFFLIWDPPMALALFAAYVAAMALASLWLSVGGGRLGLAPRILALFLITHIAYGAGELWGIGRKVYQGKVDAGEG